MPKLVLANTSTATYRRVYFDLRQSDGLTPATAEAGGQPQISVNGAVWTDSGIGALSAIGNGRYYADLDQASVVTAGTMLETRYKSAATIDCPGDSIHVVAFNPHDAVHLGLSAIPNADSTTVGGLPTVGTGTNQVSMDGAGNVNSNLATWTGAVPNALTTGRVDTTVGATQTGSISATALAAGAIHATAIASNAITAATIASDADTEIAASVWNAVRATYTTVGSFGEGVASVQGSITGNLAGSVGTVTGGVTVTTNNDKTGYTVAVGGIGATAFAANAVDSGAFAVTAAQKVADEVLNRDLVGGSSGNTRNVRNTLRSLRNKTAIAAGTLTVYQEDDSTSAWTAAVVTTAGDPISSIDPA